MNILRRFLKVIYVFLLFLGLIISGYSWLISSPYTYLAYTYRVTCENGKAFDPTSKPISRIPDKSYYQGKYEFSLKEPFSFNENEIKSECEYGVAWMDGLSSRLPKNYFLTTTEKVNTIGSQRNQIKLTLITFIVYYLFLEIVRRTFLYIFLGRNFFTLKLNTKI